MKYILNDIKQQAVNENLPIIMDDMEGFLHDEIKNFKPKSILEIGTANGFSASVILSSYNKCNLTTIEKDEQRFKWATKNLKAFHNRVKVINDDALIFLKTYVDNLESKNKLGLKNSKNKFDFIFMDGPKAQYITYLPYLVKILNNGGEIICDNVFFHGMVTGQTPIPKSIKSMIAKLQQFLLEAQSLKGFTSTILNYADGILILKKN